MRRNEGAHIAIALRPRSVLQAFAAAERLLEQLHATSDTTPPIDGSRSEQAVAPHAAASKGHERQQHHTSDDENGSGSAARSGTTASVDRRMPVEACVDYVSSDAEARDLPLVGPAFVGLCTCDYLLSLGRLPRVQLPLI